MASNQKKSRMQIPRGEQTPHNQPANGQTAQWNMPNEAGGYRPASSGNHRNYRGAGNQGGPGYSGSPSHQNPNAQSRVNYAPGNNPNGPRGFDMGKPKKGSVKKKILVGVLVLVLVCAGLVGADFALNNGKVHYGIKVEGIDIGGMTKAEATTTLQSKLDSKLAGASVQVKADAATEERLASHTSVSEDGTEIVSTEETGEGEGVVEAHTWSFSATDLGAQIDAAVLVDEAMKIGEVDGFLDFFSAMGERFGSWTGAIDLEASVGYDDEVFLAALQTINDAIGITMVNSNISIDGEGYASIQTGHTGEKVNEDLFKDRAQKVLLGDSTEVFEATLVIVPLDIDDAEAQVVADQVNAAIAEPVTFAYESNTWTAGTSLLGSWISTTVEGDGEAAQLIPRIDPTKGYDGIQDLLGEVGYGTAQNATIDVSSGTPVIVGGTVGAGPDINTGIEDLNNILFGSGDVAREVVFTTAEVEPAVTAEDVAGMGITDLIASYELNYGAYEGTNRDFNIERCLDTLSGSIIAPGQNWDWNEVVGQCDETTGYKNASIINANNEFAQAAGGGICNVATGVYNAAYDAGLPIVSRSNHSIYMSRYPLGRDAAVSWQYPTLTFANDTDNYILVTASYDGGNMIISIWGTNQGRTVESSNSEWTETEEGKSITNYRTVYNADGSVRLNDSFYSYYKPENKPEEQEAEE